MKNKLTYFFLFILIGMMNSCTSDTEANTLIDCPCKVTGIEINELRGYKIVIQETKSDKNWLSFYSHYSYKIGDTIQ